MAGFEDITLYNDERLCASLAHGRKRLIELSGALHIDALKGYV
jgi:hypothetical protein